MLVKTQNKSALGVKETVFFYLSSRIIFYKLRKRENDVKGKGALWDTQYQQNFYLFTPTVWGCVTVEASVRFHSSAGQSTAR